MKKRFPRIFQNVSALVKNLQATGFAVRLTRGPQ